MTTTDRAAPPPQTRVPAANPQRFGLVHVDFATQKRTPKASANWYSDLIRSARRSQIATDRAGARRRDGNARREGRLHGPQLGR
ncbi:family 1 glycosylhydrolase [Bradyrhizobium sp. I71]|uniref:family 1 glycosylhydrolase n=1 Tax=Bradyrhizobium sp. I71 TaxID=2590772 RepID=UPI0023777BF6|nr:family 1 glycosylhydrolase [Bradyrhizobium sp. I71]